MDSLEFDVVIVGAGPAGLSAAIRLKQLNPEINVCILEKGAEVGSHILSGAVMDPCVMNDLCPGWQEKLSTKPTKAQEDHFLWMTERKAFGLPVPDLMKNTGNYIISLSDLCRFLGQTAAALGVEIFAGFAGVDLIYNDVNVVCGVITGEKGILKNGEKSDRYQPGVGLYAKTVLLAEGCRGFLTQKVIARYDLDKASDPPTYALGVKELWRVNPSVHQPGKISHSVGWPLDYQTYGGSFLYHFGENLLSVGMVVGLDFADPRMDPFLMLQRFKCHPSMKHLFKDAERIAYGARVLCEGGIQSLPKLEFPGGLLIGDSAGLLNVGKIKGIHLAMQSGVMAAKRIVANEKQSFTEQIRSSWIGDELKVARNIRPGFRFGLVPGLINAALEMFCFKGRSFWTLKQKGDTNTLKPKKAFPIKNDFRPDNRVTFDKSSSLYLANISHAENQPVHLIVGDQQKMLKNIAVFGAPETFYCPANVYEIITREGQSGLQINAQNCLHCKACDIKEPFQNITWTPPEGGCGPNYSGL